MHPLAVLAIMRRLLKRFGARRGAYNPGWQLLIYESTPTFHLSERGGDFRVIATDLCARPDVRFTYPCCPPLRSPRAMRCVDVRDEVVESEQIWDFAVDDGVLALLRRRQLGLVDGYEMDVVLQRTHEVDERERERVAFVLGLALEWPLASVELRRVELKVLRDRPVEELGERIAELLRGSAPAVIRHADASEYEDRLF